MSSSDPLLDLLEAAREGDDRAVNELVLRTQSAVGSLCRALGSHGAEEDLAQETYLRAFRSLGQYRGEAPVQAWLLSIARRVCADDVRRRTRQRALRDRLTQQAPTMSSTTALTTPGHYGDLFVTLDPERREAFLLTQVAGLSYEDAAAVVGCPIGTIRSRVARARADLLTQLRQADAV